MRTKTLLLTAALSAAGLATSMAQVYSVNAVGYVNQTVPAGGFAILANPLNGTNNNINTIIPLPHDGSYDGANVYRFNRATQSYRETMSFVSGPGWLSADPADETLNPGEGFFIQNIAGVPMPLTFVGEVPQGAALSQSIVGGNGFNLASSIVPKGLPIGYTGSPNVTLGYPATDGDNCYIFNSNTQQYEETYAYVDSVGWLHPTDPNTDGPVIAPGTGFWMQRAGSSGSWTQSFSVN
jgi:hypothetical protein